MTPLSIVVGWATGLVLFTLFAVQVIELLERIADALDRAYPKEPK